MTKNVKPSGKPGRGLLWASLVLFLLFAANVAVGKIAVTAGASTAPGVGDVGEFLILFATVVLFIAACLARERAEAGTAADAGDAS